MQQQSTPPSAAPAAVIDVEQAEAALVEHYPRLVRLAYLVLPPGLGRNRRVLTAHSVVQRALPRGRTADAPAPIPAQRDSAGRTGDPGFAYVRLKVLRSALEAGLPLRRTAWPKRAQLPPLLPQVWGLRLFPKSGGADELALDQQLSALSGPARAAYVLRGLERLDDAAVRAVLTEAGCTQEDAAAALAEARGLAADAGFCTELLESPEFDPCSLHARPTDLMRRRQHLKAAIAAVAATLVCGALLGLPGEGWAPDGAAAPPYAKNPAGQAALNPAKLHKVAPDTWKTSARTDFSVWPARGSLTGDKELLRRALAVWARPGGSVKVSATPGTPAGAPPGPPQLLYAGELDQARVVLFYDGLRIVRYAEPKNGTSGAALDFARVDGAADAQSSAVVMDRADGNVRYLTAPWVAGAATRDLLKPSAGARALSRTKDGVTAPFPSPALATSCTSWNALALTDSTGTRLTTDLGELVPAHLTSGSPAEPREARPADWATTACSLAAARSHGVRSVNSWAYARQALPESNGTAEWWCTRADTWRGGGPRTLALFRAPGADAAVVAAKSQSSPACGSRDPQVLAGVRWKSREGAWYLVAAGSAGVNSVSASGRSASGRMLAVRVARGADVSLSGRTARGAKVQPLR
ncbi:hypothetical protein OG746_29945 [Streptomyces sp. NBC_01016]|uniref:hypothetical protein n=1 Tax=Streptomyces sp. NBC_01016 TaxID=2903720 RepID=UPI0022575F45|nr:hypothetical protein [Streptomyces sp. NBC_01016]MCX4832962.1 hypothetical protein [Streptomyces sp. NBC_01016]